MHCAHKEHFALCATKSLAILYSSLSIVIQKLFSNSSKHWISTFCAGASASTTRHSYTVARCRKNFFLAPSLKSVRNFSYSLPWSHLNVVVVVLCASQVDTVFIRSILSWLTQPWPFIINPIEFHSQHSFFVHLHFVINYCNRNRSTLQVINVQHPIHEIWLLHPNHTIHYHNTHTYHTTHAPHHITC